MSLAIKKETGRAEPSSQIEEATRRAGQELFRRVHEESSELSPLNRWTASVFKWCLKDLHVKSNLLRFVDAFPSLKSDKDVIRHIREYFSTPSLRLPMALKLGVAAGTRLPLTGRAVSGLTRHMITQVARQFIAGKTPEETFEVIDALERQGMAFTLDLLGEATLTDREAQGSLGRYQKLMKDVAAHSAKRNGGPEAFSTTARVNLSVKLSSLCARFDPIHPEETCAEVLGRLMPLFNEAVAQKAFINIDMESYEFRDLTLMILKKALEHPSLHRYPHWGIVFQAYLRDSGEVLKDFLRWLEKQRQPMTIRLVKGAYWDFEVARATAEGWPSPVFLSKEETDANFERLTETLLHADEMVRVAVASHNVRSLSHAIALAETLKVPKTRLEFQLLYGMADALKKALVKMGQPVRVYVPQGELIPGMAYLVRRLLENTANESFLKHDFLHESSEEELLRDPLTPRAPGLNGNGRTVLLLPAKRTETEGFRNEPLLDFSQEEARRMMQDALKEVRSQLGRDHAWSLAGEWVYSRVTLNRLNPSHRNDRIGRANKATHETVLAAVRLAKAAQGSWARRSAGERAKLLKAAARELGRRRLEIAAWEVFETGKNWREADADVVEAVDYLNYYAEQAVILESGVPLVSAPGERNICSYKPLGVGAVIAPWNFPAAILTGMTAAALATGNTVIVKPSEQSTFTALKVIEALHHAGIPPEALLCLPGEGPVVGSGLVEHPDISFVAFTGSREVGLEIIRKCAEVKPGQKHLKRVICEMGGKNAVVVDDDADLDEAVKGIIASAFGYGGQKCSACSRAVILDRVYNTAAERIVEAARGIVVAPSEEARCMMGPLIDEAGINRVKRAVTWGLQGSKRLYEGDLGALAREGYYVGPVVFGEVGPESRLAQEEVFGPVLSLMRAKNFDEALQIANLSQYALTGGLYSRSLAHIERARRDFDVGNLYINRKITGARVGQQPFGGHKLSGYGTKAGGPDYLLQFVVPQTTTENTLRHGFPLQD